MGPSHRQHHTTFTLVELMIVVAIIQVLAAIAIPNFYQMQMRAKRSEAHVLGSGLMDSLKAYAIENEMPAYLGSCTGNCLPATVATTPPSASLGKAARPFVTTTWTKYLGWSPDGQVYGSYGFSFDSFDTDDGCDYGGQSLMAEIYMDLDGDTDFAKLVYCSNPLQPSSDWEREAGGQKCISGGHPHDDW